MLLKLEFDEGIDHRVVDAAHHFWRHAFVDGHLASVHHLAVRRSGARTSRSLALKRAASLTGFWRAAKSFTICSSIWSICERIFEIDTPTAVPDRKPYLTESCVRVPDASRWACRGGYRDSVRKCAECEFDFELAGRQGFAAASGPSVDGYVDLLQSTSVTNLRRRPSRRVWSPLEYACHVRDLLLVQRERVFATRRRDRPIAEAMGRDERVEQDGYNDQHPTDVARQLSDAMLLLANAFGRLSPADWERTLIYPYAYPDPNPGERSLRWMALHTLHELHHHLVDIRRQLDQSDAARSGRP